jgi:uncharacterized protein DUF6968
VNVDDVIAATELIGETKDRGRFSIHVRIGRPYLRSTNPDIWACPVSITPLHERLADIAGEDSFQALCLASRMAASLLEGFVRSGGRLLNDDGTAFSVDVLGFGARERRRRPRAPAPRSRETRRKRRTPHRGR